MYKIRIRFTKTAYMKFISHLDLMRMMERTMRRCQVPLSFSQGFNPHPKISFATALALGISSEGEYMDIEIDEKIDLEGFKENMNKEFPEGISILQCKYIDIKRKSLMALVEYSTYVVRCPIAHDVSKETLNGAIDSFMKQDDLLIYKTVKKKNREMEKEVNIRPMIHHMQVVSNDSKQFLLKTIVATGSNGNLKPEILLQKFRENTNIPIIIENIRIHRLDLLTLENNQFVTPFETTK